jgi:S-formylglutathione hydrolase FrmB
VPDEKHECILYERQPTDTTFLINGREVTILYPKNGAVNGTILCLPGWNFSRTDMCEKSNFCSTALDSGFVLVLPEMGRSIYASSIYNETRPDWKKYPQLKFITDTLIPQLNTDFSLLNAGDHNFIFGISTGGRGVGVLAAFTKTIFKAGAALSGDYNPPANATDNLMRGYYGELSKFKARWEKDSPFLFSDSVTIPLYLAHGKNDNVVSCNETIAFFKKLTANNSAPKHRLSLNDTASHNYGYWQTETKTVIEFFIANKK